MFLGIAGSILSAALALACGEREEYKGSGSRSLEDPTADGSVSGPGTGGGDANSDGKVDSAVSDAEPDSFVADAGLDAKTDG